METNVQSAIRKSADIQRKFSVQSQSGNDKLGKSDFLNLFMTQLSKQDPLDPMDSSKMMQQISQMGSMEQLQNMNRKLDRMHESQGELARYQSLAYLNRDVSYADDSLEVVNGRAKAFEYHLPETAEKLKINVRDAAGTVVFEDVLERVPAGDRHLDWSGEDQEGKGLPDGKYSVGFLATDEQGGRIEIDSNRVGKVSQIKFLHGKPQLMVDGKFRDASEVRLVESDPLYAGAEPIVIGSLETPEAEKQKTGDADHPTSPDQTTTTTRSQKQGN